LDLFIPLLAVLRGYRNDECLKCQAEIAVFVGVIIRDHAVDIVLLSTLVYLHSRRSGFINA
ncbi:hypothetical protein DV965_16655, partial [Staphylococcus pseudintermedius]|uniref:hypothetical protein n=1 Tax=Staphylococcus pseudintermedius TaxID=283734 RepID=UPI000E3868DE